MDPESWEESQTTMRAQVLEHPTHNTNPVAIDRRINLLVGLRGRVQDLDWSGFLRSSRHDGCVAGVGRFETWLRCTAVARRWYEVLVRAEA